MGVVYGPRRLLSQGQLVDLDAYSRISYSGSGSTWYDLSGNNNNFTLYNTPTFSNNALTFNGTNQYGSIASLPNTTGMTAFSVSVFGKVDSNIPSTPVFFTLNNIITGIKLNPASSGLSYVYSQAHLNTIGNIFNDQSIYLATNGTWYHFVACWSSGKTIKLYVNGALYSTSATTYSGTISNPTGANIANYANSSYAPCTIGKIGLWNIELTAAQITTYCNAFRGRYGI